MTEVRVKDKLFLACVVPLAALAAYFYLYRADAAKTFASLRDRCASLVAEGDYADALADAVRARDEARRALEEERAAVVPAKEVRAEPTESVAERERAVLSVFRSAGLHVVSASPSEGPSASAGRAGDALRATGTRPGPVRRVYLVDGSYPSVARALARFVERKMAVVMESFAMSDAPVPRWKLEVWL